MAISVGLGMLLSSLISAGGSAINSSAQKKATEEANRTNNLNNTLDAINNKQSLINNSGVNNIMGERINQFRCGGKKAQNGTKIKIVRDYPEGYDAFWPMSVAGGSVNETGYLHKFTNGDLVLQRQPVRFIPDNYIGNKDKQYNKFLNKYYKGRLANPNTRAEAMEEWLLTHPNDERAGSRVIDPNTGIETYMGGKYADTVFIPNTKKCGGKTKLKHKVNGGQDRQEKVDFMDRISFYKRNR